MHYEVCKVEGPIKQQGIYIPAMKALVVLLEKSLTLVYQLTGQIGQLNRLAFEKQNKLENPINCRYIRTCLTMELHLDFDVYRDCLCCVSAEGKQSWESGSWVCQNMKPRKYHHSRSFLFTRSVINHYSLDGMCQGCLEQQVHDSQRQSLHDTMKNQQVYCNLGPARHPPPKSILLATVNSL